MSKILFGKVIAILQPIVMSNSTYFDIYKWEKSIEDIFGGNERKRERQRDRETEREKWSSS